VLDLVNKERVELEESKEELLYVVEGRVEVEDVGVAKTRESASDE